MEGKEETYFHTFYFQAFSDQFAIVSEEVDHLVEDGQSLVSSGKTDPEGELSAKLQDVRRRFLRIQELVEKQNELNVYERFESAVEDYRKKFDAVRIGISSRLQYEGATHSSAEEQDQFTSVDESLQALEELGKETILSVSEEEKTKINALLNELRISLQTLKRRISSETLDEDVPVGETTDTEGLGEEVCIVETGGSNVITTCLRFGDDSDIDNEEHRMSKGSSDGSQYGSDSGMGDSLMNTLASECTDGSSKTPTVSPVNNIAQKESEGDEASDSGDTICGEVSPINEHDRKTHGILDHITETKPERCRECEQNIPTQGTEMNGHIAQKEVANRTAYESNITTNNPAGRLGMTQNELPIESSVPLNHKAPLVSGQDDSLNTMIYDKDVTEDNAALYNIAQKVTLTCHEGSTTVSERDASTSKQQELTKRGQDPDSHSLEYLCLPQATLQNVPQPHQTLLSNDFETDNLKSRTKLQENTELNDQTNSDSRPFLPTEYLLPEYATSEDKLPGYTIPEHVSSEEALQNDSLPKSRFSEHKPSGNVVWAQIPSDNVLTDRTLSGHTRSKHSPTDHTPSKHPPSEHTPSEHTSSEHTPSEHTPSEGSSPDIYPQGTRDHDIDEELLIRSLALQNVYTDGAVGGGQDLVNDTEYPLVSCTPPLMKTVEEFIEEPEVLFQRLVDIEVMLRPQGKDGENLKSALFKHVALCVEMKNIQSKMNIINRHGQYFMKKARSGLREILEERLKALNNQWDKLQDHASARQKDLEQLVQDEADNELMSGEDSSLNALRNNTALLSSLYYNTENEDIKRLLNKLGLFSADYDEDDSESRRHFDDDYLDYQSAFHDLFEWLTVTEEDVQSVSTLESEVKEMRQRLKRLQDLCRQVQQKKLQLDDLVKRSTKFVESSDENSEDHVTELRHLWRDVMLNACTKLRDLQNVLHVVMMRALHVERKEEFSKTLSECELDVKDLLERMQECSAADVSDEYAPVAMAQYQVFSSEADFLTKVLNYLKTSPQNAQNSATVDKLSNEITNVKTQLESWRKQLGDAGAMEINNPVEESIELRAVSPEEARSPRGRPKTWPGHSNLPAQVMAEVKQFEDWLATTEENLQTFIGIAIPQTLNEMKSKLKEVQLVARTIHKKISEVEYTLNSLTTSPDETEYTELCEKCQACLTRAKELKTRSDTRTNELKDIRFQWELFDSRFAEMCHWLEKTQANLILPLKEKDEDSVEFVLGKLLKVREIEKKLSEKVTVKDDVLRQGERVLARTEAADVNVKIEQLREEWAGIESDLGKERARLEKIMRLWKDYERKQEEMYEWLTGILASLRALEHRDKTIDVVKSQLSLIQKHHDEIDNHLTLKESVDLSFHFLVDNIQGDVGRLQVKQQQLNSHWQELQSLVSDRFDELVEVEWELEKANMTASVEELNVCVETTRRLVLVRVPPIGSSSLEEIKSLVARYQNAKRELRSKQEKLDELKRKSKGENIEVEKCATLRQSIAQLDEDWKQVTSSLGEKEEFLKTSLNNWIEFQRQLTHLVDTDSWFATREAAMTKYQHISTEKDRDIALEDVKAMKGFLVTQKISVTAFVESARGLLSEGVYDSEEIEGILGDIEERWVDINTKVNDCEEWLCEMTTKHKSCRDSIGSIMAFLDETELMLQSLALFDGDLSSLLSQKTKLCNLETELNDLRSTVYNLNSILVELGNVCDESVVYELEKDIQELNQRYGSITEQTARHKAQTEEMISACQVFDKDCAELFAWLEYQSEVLDRDEDSEPPLLASELAQLKECEHLQEDFNRQQEFLNTVRGRGQELKSKIKQGNLYVSPKLTKLARKFSDFAIALNQKQERLKMKTGSWLEFCDKLQTLDERMKESEELTYTTRYSDTKEHYRLLQKLIREAIQMRPELEELVEFTEENFTDQNSEQGKNARNEVEELRQRLEILTAELDSKKTEVETVQKLQAKFQEQCRHLNAVLQDTEVKLICGDDVEHLHEQEQSFEFFESNSDRYKEELLCAQRLAETLDQNTSVDANTRSEVEEKFNELKQRWENTCRAVEKHRETMENRLVKWRDFKRKHKAFVSWLTEFETRPGLQPVASSDITELESQVEYVEACRRELDVHQNEFDLLHATTEQCLNRSTDTVTDAVEKEYHDAEERWLRVSDSVASNQRTLELTLGDWQEYTTVMEDTMRWLRQTELYLKTCSAASLADVEKYYERLKELSDEIEERRPHLELLTQRGKRLSRMSSYANADHINNQVSVMGTLWTNVCTCLSTKMHCTIDSLHYLRKFVDNFESLSAWLDRLESILRRDWKHFYSCSPEEQRAKIKAYRKEIESHEAQRTSINDSTLQLIDKELGNELLRHVMEQRDALNERWEALCIQLGISYKKAEQTKYSLKLLEAQLTQLNKWMTSVERQITEFSEELSCDIDELSQQLVDLQISQREINARSPDVISVLSLCVRLQSCAFPDESDTRDLQIARDSFESRWKKISRNVGQLLRQNQDRIALCKEFRDDYKQFITWLRTFENQVSIPSGRCEDLHELSLEISRLQDLKRQVGAKGVLVERLLTRGNCLVNGSSSSSAKLIRQMIAKSQERWYDITQELDDSIAKFHLLSKDFVEFEEERRNVNAWLTDIEVRLIGLEQVGNEQQDEEQRLQELKTLQHHINMKYGSLSDLTSQVAKLKGCCSISDYRLQQQKVEELKLRYEQALHYSLTLMLDLAVPSPFASPNRVSTRLNLSEVTP